MGINASSLVNPNSDVKEPDNNMVQQLDVLMKLADARLDSFEHELEMRFVDKESERKRSVPGKRALRFDRHVGVNVGSKIGADKTIATSSVTENIEAAVDAFLHCGKSGPKTEVAASEGFKSVVVNAFSSTLSDTSAGESVDKKFFVCIQHNAIVRVDVMTYRYNFRTAQKSASLIDAENEVSKLVTAKESDEKIKAAEEKLASLKKENEDQKSFVDRYSSIFAYIICVSVVDHREVSDDEIIYLASEFAGDDVRQFDAYLDTLIRVWNKLSFNGVGSQNRLTAA